MSDDESSVQFRDESESESVQFNQVADDDDDDSVAFHELESDRENPSFRQQPGSWFFRRGSSRSMTPSGNASGAAPGQKPSSAQIRSASSDTSPQPSPRETASSPQTVEQPPPASAADNKPSTPAAPVGSTIRSGTPPTQIMTEAASKDRENSGNQPKPKKSVVANRLAEKPLTSGNGARRVPPSRGRNGSAGSMDNETESRESPKKTIPKTTEILRNAPSGAEKDQESTSSAAAMKADNGASNVGGTAKASEVEPNKGKTEESATQSKGKSEASHIRQSSTTPLTRQATGTFEASTEAPSGAEKQPTQQQQHVSSATKSATQTQPEIGSYAKQSREASPERVVTEEELNEAKEVTTSTRRFRKQQEKELALVTARLQEAQGAVAVAPSFIPLREQDKRYSTAVPGINPRPRSESPGARPQSATHDGHPRASSSHGKPLAPGHELLGATVQGRLGERSTGGPRPEAGPPIPTGRGSHADPRRTFSPTKSGRQAAASEAVPPATYQASGLPHGPTYLKSVTPASSTPHAVHSVDPGIAPPAHFQRASATQFVSSTNSHKGARPSPAAAASECKICESQKQTTNSNGTSNTNSNGKRNSQQHNPNVSIESLALKVAAERQLLVPDEAFPIDSIDGLRTNLPWFRLNGVKASSREVEAFVRGVKRLVAQQRGASPSQAAAEYPSPVRAGRKQPQPPRRSNTTSLRAVFELLDVCQRGYLVVKHLHAALHQIRAARGKEPPSFEECFAIDVVMPALAEEGAGFPEVDFPTMSQIVLQYLDHNEHTQIRSTLGPIYTPRQYLEALA